MQVFKTLPDLLKVERPMSDLLKVKRPKSDLLKVKRPKDVIEETDLHTIMLLRRHTDGGAKR